MLQVTSRVWTYFFKCLFLPLVIVLCKSYSPCEYFFFYLIESFFRFLRHVTLFCSSFQFDLQRLTFYSIPCHTSITFNRVTIRYLPTKEPILLITVRYSTLSDKWNVRSLSWNSTCSILHGNKFELNITNGM